MFKTAQTRKEQAVEAVREMVARGETMTTMPFDENGGELVVTSEKGLVLAFDGVEVDGRLYRIGFKM